MKDNNITKSNAKFAGWIEDFVANFAKTTQKRETEASKETVAEINISDLDKVVWNDETFYVYFDETGASVINAFGNIVTSLDGVMTLEDVNKQLNSKQIVSSIEEDLVVNAEMESEIEKALSEIEIEADIEDDMVAKEYVDTYNNEQPVINSNDSQVETTAEIEETIEEEIVEEVVEEIVEEVVEDDAVNNESFDTKLMEMEERLLNKFEEKMNAMMEQLYARMNPGNVYDMGSQVQQEEILKFTEEAYETEKQIAEENSIDRTLADNKYSTEEVVNEVVTEVKETIEEEIVEEVAETVEEIEMTEEIVEEILEDVTVLEESEAEEVTEEVDTTNIIELEEIEEMEEIEIVGEDAEVFKTAKCPYCANSLSKTTMLDDSIEIHCDDMECDSKFKVDLNTGKIYLV